MAVRPALHWIYLRGHFAARVLLGIRLFEQLRFLLAHGRWPQPASGSTFNDKLFARKCGRHDARYTIVSDKVAVRAWVAQRIGPQHLVPALAVYDYHQLDQLEVAPGQVIKCANRSGGVYFTDGEQAADRDALIQTLREKLDFDFAAWTGEIWYRDIPKRVIVEKRLGGADGSVPRDYKFFVFHGVVQAIQVHINRFSGHRIANFDRQWQALPVRIGLEAPDEPPVRPACLARMVEIAETLGRELDFVRVDLYEIDGNQVYFGEMTFAPASGLYRFEPFEYDRIFGGYW